MVMPESAKPAPAPEQPIESVQPVQPVEPIGGPVNHPRHYNFGRFEVIDVLEDWQLGFHDGNAVKYLARWRHKNGLEDLKKARWYLDRLIAIESTKKETT